MLTTYDIEVLIACADVAIRQGGLEAAEQVAPTVAKLKAMKIAEAAKSFEAPGDAPSDAEDDSEDKDSK